MQKISMGAIAIYFITSIGFVTLKLFKIINWSWFWVISPVWIFLFLVLFAAIIYVLTINPEKE